jgi:hypothetical protein
VQRKQVEQVDGALMKKNGRRKAYWQAHMDTRNSTQKEKVHEPDHQGSGAASVHLFIDGACVLISGSGGEGIIQIFPRFDCISHGEV